MGILAFTPEGDLPGDMKRILEDKKQAILKAIVKGINFGADLVLGDIIEQQFSGRPGLNRRSGSAANLGNWFKRTDVVGGSGNFDIDHKVGTRAKIFYVQFHEASFPDMAPKIPKRLHIQEYFKTEGVKIYMTEISDALKGL